MAGQDYDNGERVTPTHARRTHTGGKGTKKMNTNTNTSATTRKTTTLNGTKFDGVGLVTATREGTGNGEKLGDVIALRIVKGERREIRPLADILKGTADLIAGTVFEKFTKTVYKERSKALKAANEFAKKSDVDLLPLEGEEFSTLEKDEKADKGETRKADKKAAANPVERIEKALKGLETANKKANTIAAALNLSDGITAALATLIAGILNNAEYLTEADIGKAAELLACAAIESRKANSKYSEKNLPADKAIKPAA